MKYYKKNVFLLAACTLFMLTFSAKVELENTNVKFETYLENYNFFKNLTVYLSFLDNIFNELSGNDIISAKCQNDTRKLLEKASDGDVNALKILDSTGKPSSGVLEGGVFFIGFYSECVRSVVKTIEDDQFSGKYCLLNLNFSGQPEQNIPQASWLVLTQGQKNPTIGICVPSTCSETDLSSATNASLKNKFYHVEGNVSICHGDPSGFSSDPGALLTLSVLILVIILAASGTAIDLIQSGGRGCTKVVSGCSAKSASQEVLCEEKPIAKSSYFVDFLLSFSLRTNSKKIFGVEDGGENIRSLHGLKFLSMALIILGHTFSFASQNLFFRNPGAAVEAPRDFISQIFANGTLAVDTFYFISGFLVVFVTLKGLQKTDGKFPCLYFYFHRYFRLTPLLAITVLYCAFLLRYIGSGPNWLSSIQMYDVWCKQNGWLNILYLHNFINTQEMCLSHTWYLATDMQFYLVVPLILIPLHKNFKYGFIVMALFLFATTLTTALLTVINNYPAIPYINNIVPLSVVNDYYKNVYIKPYCRMGPYIIGIAAGYYVLSNKELVLKKITVVFLWLCSIALGLTIIYLMWPANQGYLPTPSEAAAYSSLARTAWAVSIAWLVLACFYGYGGIINSILSWKPLVPLSRLTYCAYLIHPVVMNVYYGCTETLVDYSVPFVIYLFLGNICITFALSILLSLMFESPFVALEKAVISKIRQKS